MTAPGSSGRLVAGPGFNRWLIPPAALAIHLSIGQAYAFSVFNLPLSRAIGITAPAPADWKLTQIGWTFTLAIVFLGLSAAVFGRWLERVGPRTSGLVAAACWSGGFLVAAARRSDPSALAPAAGLRRDRAGADSVSATSRRCRP